MNADESTDARHAAMEWIDGTIPLDPRFGDTFYTREDGRAETGHVFIEGNALPARWPRMRDCRIGELGFGTGLNFLETVAQWRVHATEGSRLHFLSFEQFPMAALDMAKALSRWPELGRDAARLLEIWKPEAGTIDCPFAPGVRLTVFLSDANIALPQARFAADAWYLDGFSPSRNPQLWNEALMRAVFERTAPGGTLATYAAAGFVRRNLQAAGFVVERATGFGRKREMLKGSRPLP